MTLTKRLIADIATAEHREVVALINDKSFESAYQILNGYNLSVEPNEADGHYLAPTTFFEFRYKHLSGVVFAEKGFLSSGGEGELGEMFSFYLGDKLVANLEIGYYADSVVREEDIELIEGQ